MMKLALIAAIAAVVTTSSAFAQAFDPEVGTGNVQAFSYSVTQNGHESGRNAYGMVSGNHAGTGSAGYTTLLDTH